MLAVAICASTCSIVDRTSPFPRAATLALRLHTSRCQPLREAPPRDNCARRFRVSVTRLLLGTTTHLDPTRTRRRCHHPRDPERRAGGRAYVPGLDDLGHWRQWIDVEIARGVARCVERLLREVGLGVARAGAASRIRPRLLLESQAARFSRALVRYEDATALAQVLWIA